MPDTICEWQRRRLMSPRGRPASTPSLRPPGAAVTVRVLQAQVLTLRPERSGFWSRVAILYRSSRTTGAGRARVGSLIARLQMMISHISLCRRHSNLSNLAAIITSRWLSAGQPYRAVEACNRHVPMTRTSLYFSKLASASEVTSSCTGRSCLSPCCLSAPDLPA